MLFGLKTAGSGFIRSLNQIFERQFDDYLTVYIDNLLITSATFDKHLEHICAVFARLQKHNCTLRLDKSFLFCKSANFLGFVLSVDGRKPALDRLEAMENFA